MTEEPTNMVYCQCDGDDCKSFVSAEHEARDESIFLVASKAGHSQIGILLKPDGIRKLRQLLFDALQEIKGDK